MFTLLDNLAFSFPRGPNAGEEIGTCVGVTPGVGPESEKTDCPSLMLVAVKRSDKDKSSCNV